MLRVTFVTWLQSYLDTTIILDINISRLACTCGCIKGGLHVACPLLNSEAACMLKLTTRS